jgi:hypothetical protein
MVIASRSPSSARATYLTIAPDGSDGRSCSMLSLSQADRLVLGADLNRSESRLSAPLHCGISIALCPLWVISDRDGPGHTTMHVRFAPKADMREPSVTRW